MSAEKIIHTLLTNASAVTAVIGAGNIWPGELPQGTPLPALGVSHISTTELPTLDASALFGLLESRIEVTVLAKDYATVKSLLTLVRKACNYQRGSIAGLAVASIRRDLVGADARDSDLQVFSQTLDFIVTWQDPT